MLSKMINIYSWSQKNIHHQLQYIRFWANKFIRWAGDRRSYLLYTALCICISLITVLYNIHIAVQLKNEWHNSALPQYVCHTRVFQDQACLYSHTEYFSHYLIFYLFLLLKIERKIFDSEYFLLIRHNGSTYWCAHSVVRQCQCAFALCIASHFSSRHK